jgi:16S rRNA (cytidine1402-2'-O)-methyltransferase
VVVVVVVVTGGGASSAHPSNANGATANIQMRILIVLPSVYLSLLVRRVGLSQIHEMLYVVATPIGNLSDITLRALEILKNVDLVAAEDTRHSGILLKHYQINKPLISYHEHNEAMRTAQLTERLAAGENIALITDAGTPGVSDPGARLVRECIKRELPFTIIPGSSSILTALVGSGFSTDKFFFGGFLPVKSGQRERELRCAATRQETSIYFESPYRLTKTLKALNEILLVTASPVGGGQDRQLCVARELTKKFEEFRRGTAAELLAHYEARPPKGEIVLLIGGTSCP